VTSKRRSVLIRGARERRQKRRPVERGRRVCTPSGTPRFSAYLAEMGRVSGDTSVPSGTLGSSKLVGVIQGATTYSILTEEENERVEGELSLLSELLECPPKTDSIGIPISLHEYESEHLHSGSYHWHPF
jgi:hypothetical protein